MKTFDSVIILIKALQAISLAWVAMSCGSDQGGNPSSRGPIQIPKVIMELQCDAVQRNGKVEAQVSQSSFVTKSVFDQDNRPLYSERYNASGQIEWRELYKYDAKGNKVETRWYRFKNVLTTRQINFYDSVNNLVEAHTYDAYGHRLEQQTVAYGPDGSKTVSVYKPVNGTFVTASLSIYDARLQNIENRLFSFGNLISTEFNYYDERGQLTQRTHFHQPRNEERTTLFEYDSANHVTNATTLNSSMMMESKEVSIYDVHWNVWRVTTYDLNGSVKELVEHAYTYNEHGDWTKDIAFRNGKVVSMQTRIIEYH